MNAKFFLLTKLNREEMREKMRALCHCLPFSVKASNGQRREIEKANFTDNISKAYTVIPNVGNNFLWQENVHHFGCFHQDIPLTVGTIGSLSRNTKWSDSRVWKRKGGWCHWDSDEPLNNERLKDTYCKQAGIILDHTYDMCDYLRELGWNCEIIFPFCIMIYHSRWSTI